MKKIRMASLHVFVLFMAMVLLPCFALGGSIFKTWGDISLSYPDSGWKLFTEASIRHLQQATDMHFGKTDDKILIALNSTASSDIGAAALFRLKISWEYKEMNQEDLAVHRTEYDHMLPELYKQMWSVSDTKINSLPASIRGKIPKETSRVVAARIIDFKGRKAVFSHRIRHFTNGKEKDSFLIIIPLDPYAIVINYNYDSGNARLRKDVEGILRSVAF